MTERELALGGRMRWKPKAGVMAVLGVLCAPALAAQESLVTDVGTVQGVVRAESGLGIPRAEVRVEGTALRSYTRDDGTFLLPGVPVGTARVTARRLGFQPSRRDVVVTVGGVARVELQLLSAPAPMNPIAVSARREPSDSRLAGFRDRSERKTQGYFLTRERIEQSANRRTSDALRGIPGVRFVPTPRGGEGPSVRLRGARCPPLVFIDGFPAGAGEFDLESIDLHMIEGVEIYLSSTTVPPEFLGARGLEQCGVIAFWSRPVQLRQPRVRQPADPAEAARQADQARVAAYTADDVERAAYPIGGVLEISYPDSLFRASVPGETTVEFVVDARGQLNWSTFRTVSETHPLFSRAVTEALYLARWEPAQRGEGAVAQLVVMPVRFAR